MLYEDRKWTDPPARPELPEGEAHVWYLTLGNESDPREWELLNDEEVRRAERFRVDEPRHRFVCVRAALRLILGAYLRQSPRNLAFAYEQLGDWENATKHRREAVRIDPAVYTEKSLAELKGKRLSLLLPEHGGRMLAGDSPLMAKLADGLTDLGSNQYESWAVFGFKDSRTALIDQVDFYVGLSTNPVVFELLVGNESPTGPFTSVGAFRPFDGLLTETPFQPFPFEAVRARYVKFQLKEGLHWFELRVWGRLE